MALNRERQSPPAGLASKRKLIALFGLAGLELVGAYVVARLLIVLSRSFESRGNPAVEARSSDAVQDLTRVHSHAHHGGGSNAMATAAGSPPAMAWIFIAGICVGGCSLWLLRRKLDREVLVLGGLVVAVVALLPVVQTASAVSHLAMMAQLMALLVIAPALVAVAVRPSLTIAPRVARAVAIPVGLAYAFVMVAWHTTLLNGVGGPRFWVGVLSILIGLALWFGIMLDERPAIQKIRKAAIYVAAVPAGLIGLALLISSEPLVMGHHGHGDMWIGPLADQRLGGLLMMVVEAIFFIPCLLNANLAVVVSRATSDV